MLMSNQGWIKLYRQIQESDFWNNDEPFDYRSAFIDLILLANHKNGTAFDKVKISKGQYLTSIRKLIAKWHWHHRKVKRFLDLLECEGMANIQYEKMYLIITICNYNKYQVSPNGNTRGNTRGNSSGNTRGNQTRMIKNDIKNDKEEKASPSSSWDGRE